MAEMDNFLADYRKTIEDRVREQLERSFRVTPTPNIDRIVDLQIQQEKERLENLLGTQEDKIMVQSLRSLINWLPQLGRNMKRHR